MNLFGIRREYRLHALDEAIATDPFQLFGIWLQEAISGKVNEPTSMTLATASAGSFPSARIVLLKSFSPDGFLFFTNYQSRKGRELEANPKASLLFFWPELERQIRIEGIVSRTSTAVSDHYFMSRPFESRISAAASPQSEPVPNRSELEKLWQQKASKTNEKELVRPEFWGGYSLAPQNMEFWQGRPNRFHDRVLFCKDNQEWKISRLAP